MSTREKIIGVIAALALIISSVGLILIGGHQSASTSTAPTVGGVTNYDSLTLGQGQPAGAPGMNTYVTSGTCSTASTTLFAVQNPYAASSTITVAELFGTQGATTTDIVIATSTTQYSGLDSAIYNAFASSSASINYKTANFVSLTSIPTTTVFYASSVNNRSGTLFASTTNYYGTSTINNAEITVGPSEYVIGYSTSTTAGLGNGNTVSGTQPIPSSCTYKIEWQR